jgi:molybdopterin-containing oxidoreductase family membrane subunit
MTVVVACIMVGISGASLLLIKGLGETGTSDQIPWGVLVPGYVFFVAASAGCVIVSLGYSLGVKSLGLVLKRAVFLAIVTLLAGGLLIILDLGSPLRVVYFVASPNFQSPMWWMSFLYGLYLILLLAEFYFIVKRNGKTLRVISILAALSAIAVHTTLGAIFGFAAVRTYFGAALSPIYFMLIAVIIGTALLVFVTALQFIVTKREMSPELRDLMSNLGKFLGVMLGVAVLFTIWKDLTGIRSTIETTRLAYDHILTTWWYWLLIVVMGLIVPILLWLNPRTNTLYGTLVASTFVLVGMFAARVEFTLGGQMVPVVQDLMHLQHPLGQYSPTFVEVAVLLLAFAGSALLYTLGTRRLALEEVPPHG